MKHILKILLEGGFNVLSFDAQYSDEIPFHVLVEAKIKEKASYFSLVFLNGKQDQRIAITKDKKGEIWYTPISNKADGVDVKEEYKVDIMADFAQKRFKTALEDKKQHEVMLRFYDQTEEDIKAYENYFGYTPNNEDWSQVAYVTPIGLTPAKAVEKAKDLIKKYKNSFSSIVESGHTLTNALTL